jgi:hypothetical protein
VRSRSYIMAPISGKAGDSYEKKYLNKPASG